jgi:hypothetical protein
MVINVIGTHASYYNYQPTSYYNYHPIYNRNIYIFINLKKQTNGNNRNTNISTRC